MTNRDLTCLGAAFLPARPLSLLPDRLLAIDANARDPSRRYLSRF